MTIDVSLGFIEPGHAKLVGSAAPNIKLALVQVSRDSVIEAGTFYSDPKGKFEVDLKFANTSQNPIRTFWVRSSNEESGQFRVNTFTMQDAPLTQIAAGVSALVPLKHKVPLDIFHGVNQATNVLPRFKTEKKAGDITTV